LAVLKSHQTFALFVRFLFLFVLKELIMSQTLSTDEIMNIAKLARLGVNAEQADSYANDLSKILSMMDILAEVNTDNIAPLTNVHDMTQPLREDVIGGNGVEVNRELNQSIAPSVADGLYLVPQVIE
jgi:aspartyl-tRNA(Asn)/glutamyl-tRNA(Gln) amidotransferase subunit C